MMRILFWLVLLANLLFFAYLQWGSALLPGNADLQAQPPLNPEKIRLLSAPVAASAVAASAVVAQTAATSANAACMEWGDFVGDDLDRADTALGAFKLGDQLGRREVEHTIGYWVYIPSQHSHSKAEKKVAELKALGVKDYYIVQDSGKWLNAVSLGVFKTEEAAQSYLQGLQKQGVKSAVVGERQSKLKFTVFVFRNPDAMLTAKVVALQKNFPGSEVRATACH
jgi:hypothetical protein